MQLQGLRCRARSGRTCASATRRSGKGLRIKRRQRERASDGGRRSRCVRDCVQVVATEQEGLQTRAKAPPDSVCRLHDIPHASQLLRHARQQPAATAQAFQSRAAPGRELCCRGQLIALSQNFFQLFRTCPAGFEEHVVSPTDHASQHLQKGRLVQILTRDGFH